MSLNEDLNYEEFVSKRKSMLVAPAGYGKTHTISECLKYTTGKQLILTHTHAGIASIKEKIAKENISHEKFCVETITSFAQRYVLSFCKKEVIPEQENSKEYYPFLISKGTELVKLRPIAGIIACTYDGIFVDEYQDCTVLQHQFILALAQILPTHILGDHLQGIFEFAGAPLVNLLSPNEMGDFLHNQFILEKPWRWYNQNVDLGTDIKAIRKKLEQKESINLDDYVSIEKIIVSELDLYSPGTQYSKSLRAILKSGSVLLLHPDTSNLNARKKLVGRFNNTFHLVEAIDDKDFYSLSKLFDTITNENSTVIIREAANKLFTNLADWFNDKGLKSKTKEADKVLLRPIETHFKNLSNTLSFITVAEVFKGIKGLPNVNCARRDLLSSLIKALEEAHYNGISVYQAMLNRRNQVRRIGRTVVGRCIGTTLLTKGLEFETVAILNAHKFNCPKNLYVALSRASKRLVLFTEKIVLSPYDNAGTLFE